MDCKNKVLVLSLVLLLPAGAAELDLRFAVGDETKPVPGGAIWLHHFSWGNLPEPLQLSTIENGRARILLDEGTLKKFPQPDSNDGAFVVLIELPDKIWYRTPDLSKTQLLSDPPGVLKSLGPVAGPTIVLPSPTKRRIVLRNEDGTPATGMKVPVSIYLSDQNHCGVHFGPELGTFITDSQGRIEVAASLVPLYLSLQYYERTGDSYLHRAGLKTGAEAEIVLRHAWDLPKRDVELRLLKPDGSPSPGVPVFQETNTNECGIAWGNIGETNRDGRIRARMNAAEFLFLGAKGGPFRSLEGQEMGQLLSAGRLTLKGNFPHFQDVLPAHHHHDHVQGLEVSEQWFWISAVDRRTKTGWIWRLDRKNLQVVAERNITQGDLYHPGGIQLAAGSLWAPIAEYRRNSTARILQLDPMTLAERRSFPVSDHIGSVATDGKTFVLGANWDARKFYRWDMTGKLLQTIDNPRGLAIQDMKLVEGVLYTGGLEKDQCRVEILDPERLQFLREWNPGPEFCYSHEGMAAFGRNFYFLPEDEPNSRIYVMAGPQ